MKKFLFVLTALIIASMVLAACGTPATPTRLLPNPLLLKHTEAPAAPAATEAPVDANTLPRNETLYFNGQQWGPVVCWNPYSSSMQQCDGDRPAGQRPRHHVRNPVPVQHARWQAVSSAG